MVRDIIPDLLEHGWRQIDVVQMLNMIELEDIAECMLSEIL